MIPKKTYNIIFSVSFISFLTVLGLSTVMIPGKEISLIENRKLNTFSELSSTSYNDGTFQSKLESAMMDQFPGRYKLVNLNKKIEYASLNLAFYNSDHNITLRSLGNSGVSQIGNTRYMIDDLLVFDEEAPKRIIERTEQMNQLQKRHPDVQVFVYLPLNPHETSIFDQKDGQTSAGGKYLKLIEENLNLPFDYFKIMDINDVYTFYQSSDHHMNYKGLHRMYIEIMKLINKEDLAKEPISFDDHVGSTFYGSYSSRTGYLLEPDTFVKNIYAIDPYQIEYKGEIVKKDGKDKFGSIDFEKINEEYPYYYNYAYEGYEPLAKYDFNQPARPNVLLVGDSLSRGFIEVLSSSFNHTYRLIPYDYTTENHELFNYDQFIEDQDIDIVIFCYGLINYYYQDQWGDRWELTTIKDPSQQK